MKNLSVALNVVLLVAVAVLYYLHFNHTDKGVQTKSVSSSAAAAQRTNGSATIAYVDLDSLNNNITVIKNKRRELEGEQKAIESEWEAGMRGLQNKKNEFIKKYGNSITQEQAQQFEAELMDGQQKIEGRKQQAVQDLSQKSYTFLDDIQKKLKEFLTAYNKDKNYTYIFTVSSSQDYMAYKDSTLNITSDIIAGMNEKLSGAGKK